MEVVDSEVLGEYQARFWYIMYSLKHLLNAGRKNAKEEENLGQEFGK